MKPSFVRSCIGGTMHRLSRAAILAVCVTFALLAVSVSIATPARAAPRVIVSLTFDDTLADQTRALPLLAKRGYKGTWYVNSDRIGRSRYLSLAQLRTMQTGGHEVGGHTIGHVRLVGLSEAQQRVAVCGDRANLRRLGLNAGSFAYPYGVANLTTQRVVRGCGYRSGRGVAGIYATRSPYAETVPPSNRWLIRSFSSVKSTWTVSQLLGYVDRARTHSGGWLVYIFHHICIDTPSVVCPTYGIRQGVLAKFLAGLAARGISVRTVRQVVP